LISHRDGIVSFLLPLFKEALVSEAGL